VNAHTDTDTMVLLGDEAVAQGAIDAGMGSAYGYPGTPSTEIMEYLLARKDSQSENSANGAGKRYFAAWCSNEKTAYEEAVGASMAGKRALITMKHVGLNVAADPFVNSALLEINGGLVVAVADDPGMHSSQNEQDTRYFAQFARTLCLEPVNHQQAYDMTREAFTVSERFGVPVIIRLTTRISHSRGQVKTASPEPITERGKANDPASWMLLPAFARKRWDILLEKQKNLAEYTKKSGFIIYNTTEQQTSDENRKNADTKNKTVFASGQTGIITCGLGYNYLMENKKELGDIRHFLHIGAYPVDETVIADFCSKVESILIIEEGDSFLEDKIRGMIPSKTVRGRGDGSIPRTGELNPDIVRKAVGLKPLAHAEKTEMDLPKRPPQLCKGCPHRDSYDFIKEAAKAFNQVTITADIGCYALGALPPYQLPEAILCMGASVSMAKGAAEAGSTPAVAVIGDSTFYHSGITGLVDAVSVNTPVTIVILDNSTVAMTGGQETIRPSSALEPLILGVGVQKAHIKVLEAHKKYFEKNTEIMKQEMEYDGVSVIIAVRECLETARSFKKGS